MVFVDFIFGSTASLSITVQPVAPTPRAATMASARFIKTARFTKRLFIVRSTHDPIPVLSPPPESPAGETRPTPSASRRLPLPAYWPL